MSSRSNPGHYDAKIYIDVIKPNEVGDGNLFGFNITKEQLNVLMNIHLDPPT